MPVHSLTQRSTSSSFLRPHPCTHGNQPCAMAVRRRIAAVAAVLLASCALILTAFSVGRGFEVEYPFCFHVMHLMYWCRLHLFIHPSWFP